MKKVSVYCDAKFSRGVVDKKLHSSFIEHLGRGVYTGIYEPGHPEADEQGFRKDVMEMVSGLGLSMIRYPGGNFVSNYLWKDGIGPKENRPKRMDFAWSSIETNQFGIDDFCQWCEKAGIEPMIAVNLGTGTVKEAAELVEYCNHPGGTYWSDLRIKNGRKEPYNIVYWCLGNEMEGTWQAGHMSPQEYANKAREAAKMMRWVDKRIKLVACGSSYEMLPVYLEWDRIVLEELYDYVDYLSTHNYSVNHGQGQANFLASYKQLDDHIKKTAAALDFIEAKKGRKGKIKICLDEWNVWNFRDVQIEKLDDLIGLTDFVMSSAERWEEAPGILQESYTLLDALTFGGLGITVLNNADRVEISCLAQLINVIAPITTRKMGGILKQSIFYPYELLLKYGRGTVLRSVVSGDRYTCEFGEVPVVETAVLHDEAAGRVAVFALNTSEGETTLDLTLNGVGDLKPRKHFILQGKDMDAFNTFEKPDAVVVEEKAVEVKNGGMVLPGLSWNVVVYE